MNDPSILKLFIWTGFCPRMCLYKGGLAFAIAGSEQEARELVLAERGGGVAYWGELEIRSVGKVARSVQGVI